MDKLFVIFWTLILGQVVGYIGLALTNGHYDFLQVTFVSLIVAVLIILIGLIALPAKEKQNTK